MRLIFRWIDGMTLTLSPACSTNYRWNPLKMSSRISDFPRKSIRFTSTACLWRLFGNWNLKQWLRLFAIWINWKPRKLPRRKIADRRNTCEKNFVCRNNKNLIAARAVHEKRGFPPTKNRLFCHHRSVSRANEASNALKTE